jgi:hypothetical protein
MRLRVLALCAALLAPTAVQAAPLDVKVDDGMARAVLKAVQTPQLTEDQALDVARLPGSRGLIRKTRSYGHPADEALFAKALLAAARHEASEADAYFQFAKVRDAAPEIEKTLDALSDPKAHALDEVRQRIALFTPDRVHGTATGYIIVGGGSGGFAFGEPEFFLNLARFTSAPLARTIMTHELYHAVQGLAHPPAPDAACLAKLPGGKHLGELFGDLFQEGGASYVGDVLALPSDGDPVLVAERKRAETNVGRVHRSITLLELSVHALDTGAKLDYDDIYALGFYNEEILYALGYVMAKAIATERSPAALGDLLDKPASTFVTTYASLSGYGKSKDMPKLDPETLEAAAKATACGA